MANLFSFVDSTGVERYLGNIEPTGPLKMKWVVYGDVVNAPMFSRSEWPKYCVAEREMDPYLPPVHDQDGIGCCNASATVAAMESSRLMSGIEHIPLSGGDLYGRINGGGDNGSLLEDGIREAMKGVATIKTCPYLDWRQGARPTDAQLAERKDNVVLEAFICPTFEHCMSAVIAGFKLISGIMWYSNYEPDGDGWLPGGRGGAGGHAVFGYAPAMRGNSFGIWHQNSWTARWGNRQGRVVFPERSYDGPVGGWWAVRSVTTPEGDIPAPA